MNELMQEVIKIENGNIKIEKTISLEIVRVMNVLNNRDETLYTTNYNFFNNVDDILKTYLTNQIYHTDECLTCVEQFKNNVCQILCIDDFFEQFNFSDFNLVEMFFDEIITLFDKDDRSLIKDQIYVPKKDLNDIQDRLKNILPPNCISELGSKIQILSIIKSDLNSIDILDSIIHVLKEENEVQGNFTYVFKDDSGLYKIGKSKNVEARLKSFKTSNPTISIIAIYKGDFEKELHKKFSNKKVIGEWFSLTKSDLDKIEKLIKTYNHVETNQNR